MLVKIALLWIRISNNTNNHLMIATSTSIFTFTLTITETLGNVELLEINGVDPVVQDDNYNTTPKIEQKYIMQLLTEYN